MASVLWLGVLKFNALLSSALLLAFSSFEQNITLAIVGGVFTIANTCVALWWARRETRERRNRSNGSNDRGKRRRVGDKPSRDSQHGRGSAPKPNKGD